MIKVTKTDEFYTKIKEIINTSIKENHESIGVNSELRNKVQSEVNNYIENQDILKKVNRIIWNSSVFAYMLGEVLVNYISFKDGLSKKLKINILADKVYHMFVYGENPMCSADVVVLIECKDNWNKYLIIK